MNFQQLHQSVILGFKSTKQEELSKVNLGAASSVYNTWISDKKENTNRLSMDWTQYAVRAKIYTALWSVKYNAKIVLFSSQNTGDTTSSISFYLEI